MHIFPFNIRIFLSLTTTLLVYTCNTPALAQIKQQADSGRHAPDLMVKDAQGNTINVAAQKGKIVLINFWALSCIPCREELPSIDRLYLHFKDSANVLVYPVSLDYNFATAGAFMTRQQLQLPVFNPAGVVPEAFFRGVLPTTIILDKNGHIVLQKEEAADYGTDDFIGFIDRLLKK